MMTCVDTYFNKSDLQGYNCTFPALGKVRKFSWTPRYDERRYSANCALCISSDQAKQRLGHGPIVPWSAAPKDGHAGISQHHWLAMSRVMTPKWPNFSGSNQPREMILDGMMLEMFCAKILFFGKIHEGFGTPSHHCFCGTSVDMI